MLYLQTALIYEAMPYIKKFNLRRIAAPGRMQLFEGNICRLVVSGTGPVNAVVAAVYILTRYISARTDMFINIGAAGSTVINTGETVLCNKITNAFTGKEFYPDMLYNHPFREGALGSVGRPATESPYELTDMESAFVYEAALNFLPSSSIHNIKVVSDGMSPESVTGFGLEKLMSDTAPAICGWLENMAVHGTFAGLPEDNDDQLLESVSEHLRLTYAMKQKLRPAYRQAGIRGLDTAPAISEALDTKCESKNESKTAFTKLIGRLSEDLQ